MDVGVHWSHSHDDSCVPIFLAFRRDYRSVIFLVHGKLNQLTSLTLQVLNGLLSRDNQKEAISIPIGIIPAGSDNSLVWTVLGVRDPISAAIAVVKVCCNSISSSIGC